MGNIFVWAADVGSIKAGHFGCCRVAGDGTVTPDIQNDIEAFALGIARDLSDGFRVALGFECPLFVPVYADKSALPKARTNEGTSSWCAAPGATVLATGLVQTVWVFQRIRKHTRIPILPTFNLEPFVSGNSNLLIWEAFVSGSVKAGSRSSANPHRYDAELAAQACLRLLTSREQGAKAAGSDVVEAENPFSLVGAALLRSGLSSDLRLLEKPCLVIKP